MKNKQIKLIGVLLIVAIFFCLKFFNNHSEKTSKAQNRNFNNKHEGTPISNSASANDFDRTVDRIIYSRHARCRMDCRHIDETEVKEILAHGKVNERKIEQDSRGKTYPL